jgi:hypothetical protein
MTRDTFDLFDEGRRERSRFGDNELRDDCVTNLSSALAGTQKVTNLIDLDLILHNDNPSKKAIAVSLQGDTPFERWAWLARSRIEYERTGIGVNRSALVRVTLPESLAKEKGLI